MFSFNYRKLISINPKHELFPPKISLGVIQRKRQISQHVFTFEVKRKMMIGVEEIYVRDASKNIN